MLLLYNIGMRIYSALVYAASAVNSKAKLWVMGRKHQRVQPLHRSVWFHFASLGEFEQGRPVLEQLRKAYPLNPLVITFFSPSGFEVRKNTPLADAVYYLPLDTAANARQFIKDIDPAIAVFTKYEYWYHYFDQLHKRGVPLYVISSIFRPGQVFFKWYGGLHRQMLKRVTWFFVQDANSKHLLHDRGITNVTISGDTRFDRVWANAAQPKALPDVERFKAGANVFIAGSTWPADEEMIAELIKAHPGWKYIIAPHEVDEGHISALIERLPEGAAVKYSNIYSRPDAKVLVIDNIGMLSSLYQYADVAYIGGGFGAGIHNTLEAAAFGMPVLFGPKHHKFKEALDLAANGGGSAVSNPEEFVRVAGELMSDDSRRKVSAAIANAYVADNVGATGTIVEYIAGRHPAL